MAMNVFLLALILDWVSVVVWGEMSEAVQEWAIKLGVRS